MWSPSILFYLCFTITYVKAFLPNDCTTPLKVAPQYIATQCWDTWYLSASTVKCDNCCFIRKAIQIGPGKLKLIDFFRKPGDDKGLNATTVIERDPADVNVRYKDDKGKSAMKIISLDCKDYALLRLPSEELQLWVRNPNSTIVDSLPGLKTCNVTFNKFNPDKAC